jgi:hypothetical protein
VDLGGVESLLLSIHLALSIKLAAPEFELTPDEAERLAKAAQEVARHYPLIASPKAQAWAQLGLVAGMIYVPRGIAVWDRRRTESGGISDAARPQAGVAAVAGGNGAVETPSAAPSARAAATPSELDPLAALAGQTSAGAA